MEGDRVTSGQMIKKAADYREEAAQYLALARRAETQEIRHHLIEIARRYEELAQRAGQAGDGIPAAPADPA